MKRFIASLLTPLLAASWHTVAGDFTVALPPGTAIEHGSAADVSFLHEPPLGAGRPARQHGFLRADRERFQFEDGQTVRFWGQNWPDSRAVPAGEQAAELARRLARQGFNLLRIPLPATNDVVALRHFEEFSGYLKTQGIYLDLVLADDTALAGLDRTNRVTRLAPRDDAAVALFEAAAEAKPAGLHVPVAAAALKEREFASQCATWSGNEPMVKSARSIFGPMSFGAPRDRPFLVGAWSGEAANPFRAELPIWVAAIAGFQRWAGVCAESDPRDAVAWAWAPASALMFLRDDVAAASSKMLFRPATALRRDHPQFSAAAAMGLVRFEFDAAAGDPFGWMALRGEELAAVAELNPRTSDSGEMIHDREAGRLTISTPRTQAIIGFFDAGRLVETRDLRLALTNTFAAVTLSSLDGAPLPKSQRLLLTATGRADERAIEPVEGEITLKWLAPSQRDRKIFALDFSGHRVQEVPLAARGFRLDPKLKTVWYEIVAEALLPKPPPQTNAPPLKVEIK